MEFIHLQVHISFGPQPVIQFRIERELSPIPLTKINRSARKDLTTKRIYHFSQSPLEEVENLCSKSNKTGNKTVVDPYSFPIY